MDLSEMNQIYEMSKRVFTRKLSKQDAVAALVGKTTASEASLKMYFDIYASMRKGLCYKHGTSASFTEFLLNHIGTDNGDEALIKAITAAKQNSEYRESVNNAQPGIKTVCIKMIMEKSLSISYDELPSYHSKTNFVLSPSEIELIINSIKESNADFSEHIMTAVEKYQIMTDSDIKILTSRSDSRLKFHCDYSYLKEINKHDNLSVQIKDSTGKNRYYKKIYVLNEKSYVMTSQLYGLGTQQTHADNRTPFYLWILNKFNLSNNVQSDLIGQFDSWEIIDENTAIKTCDKSFFEHNGSGIPKDICWFFCADSLSQGETKQIVLDYEGTEYTGRISNESSDRRRIRIFWGNDLGQKFNSLRNDTVQHLQFNKAGDKYNVRFERGEQTVTVKESVEKIKEYIESAGFTYPDDMIENFWLCLKSKPFVILAGTSGTGKTRLVRLFAEAISAEYQLVSVRPDWSDSSDLFGHTDLSGNFHEEIALTFIKEAIQNPTKPYFLCLDEMNLARVEYYLSDILSKIETRDLKSNGEIRSDNFDSRDDEIRDVYLPQNLYIVGTVNMDETTFPFSKKVLDRANTIEFSYVNLIPDFDFFTDRMDKQILTNDFLKTDYLILKDCQTDKNFIISACTQLDEINQILKKAEAHVGYRVRDEICFYLLNNKRADLISENSAFDNEIMQKILPRIQGSNAHIKSVLCDLFGFCAGDYRNDSGTDADNMQAYLNGKAVRYPKSAEKIVLMVRRYDEDGFTSYWL